MRKSYLFLYFCSKINRFVPQNYGAMQTLPRKIVEQCRNRPQNHRAFVLCPAKLRRLRSLPRKILEQCRLFSAKLWRHSFRGQQISSNLCFFSFFLIIFVNHRYFRDLYNPLDHFLGENILCHGTFSADPQKVISA